MAFMYVMYVFSFNHFTIDVILFFIVYDKLEFLYDF